MKKKWYKEILLPTLLSLMALGVFIMLAAGCLELQFEEVTYLGDGIYQGKNTLTNGRTSTTTGAIDDQDRWNGPITKEYYRTDADKKMYRWTEEVDMVHGKREGMVTYTQYNLEGEVTAKWRDCCYKNNVLKYEYTSYPLSKSTEAATSFQVLQDTYLWYSRMMNAFGFDDSYLEGFLGEIDAIAEPYAYGDTAFIDLYYMAIDQLEGTPYDSILGLNAILSLSMGVDEMKNHEFRQAVVDRYWAGGGNTYGIIETTYSPYLLFLNEASVADPDFEQFCHVLDSTMDSYVPLDPANPFFIDSIDSYLYRALSEIMEEDSTSSESDVKKSAGLIREPHRIPRSLKEITPLQMHVALNDIAEEVAEVAEVAEVVLFSMYFKMIEGDIILKVTEQAWMENQNIVRLPTVTTEFSSNNSATSVSLTGYIIDNGGAEITENGIVWAGYFNPSVNDNKVIVATGSGEFTVLVDQLTEGSTYFARTFASNSAGIAYGNCIEFKAINTVGIDLKEMESAFEIYPNPTSGITTFRYNSEISDKLVLNIIDLKGSKVLERTFEITQGDNYLQLDLSNIKMGIYLCQIKSGFETKASQKLFIL